ncbi:5-(carboxyamino)imidazole ribonucleotide synthase [Lentibacillus cibarius]|uniref:N5-carboxyaminoimidazole ribonucleotide synthase n=1 Tax=Lentibacillus cibarius TaxID=2583219 RepID=A0A549YI59_9BACI|nr:5-(carboxyamino)imidazole ribonucleotide synthase [Lentibacillus cibarius]TRM11560.1 5-(carboxyamino)imidazole ribonucleotide synthase [Lentibacillus cibarius]
MLKNNVILPPQTIGIIGGGQLGRMMALAAKYMGYRVAVLDPTPDCPTAQVADEQVTAAYDDQAGVEKLMELSAVITYEFENVDVNAAEFLSQKGKLPQGSTALAVTQNREREKTMMQESGLPVPAFSIVTNASECETALELIQLPAVMKTLSGGYDGKGQHKLTTKSDIPEAMTFADEHDASIIEEWIPFDKEISVVFTRGQSGEVTFFPIGENEHREQILYKTTVPASINETIYNKALKAARIIAEKLEVIGTFAVEMFVKGDDVYVNEMAPRPHNSGHYTIEGCNVSQFHQHIRAVCGLPLIPVRLLHPTVMVNLLGEEAGDALAKGTVWEHGFIHFYGKETVKAKRKMGHITFTGETLDEVNHRIAAYEEEMK